MSSFSRKKERKSSVNRHGLTTLKSFSFIYEGFKWGYFTVKHLLLFIFNRLHDRLQTIILVFLFRALNHKFYCLSHRRLLRYDVREDWQKGGF